MVVPTGEARGGPLTVASGNPGKIAELVELLGDRFAVRPRPADLAETVEDGETLELNAAKKAREVSAHTGGPALADDTGLFVDALGGRPGVHTSRYAGEQADDVDNLTKLLAEMDGVVDRRAEFRTVIALVGTDGTVHLATGAVAGDIAGEPRGEAGFGYDPVFIPREGDGRTFAQMTSSEKGLISHRGRALSALLDHLDRLDHPDRPDHLDRFG